MPQHTRYAPGLTRARQLEETYARHLRKIAAHIDMIVRGWAPASEDEVLDASRLPTLRMAMERYAAAIHPWAVSTASRMVAEIGTRERNTWAEHAKTMSREIRREILNAPVGEMMAVRIAEQVADITSLPRDAAERVFNLTIEGLSDSKRASSYVGEIMRQGDVSRSRATMLARTAVGTTSSALTQARAEHVGSEGYIWRSVKDQQVRPSHRKMEGVYVPWTKPPTLDGYTAHAGCYANCRCQPQPVFAEF